MSYFWAQVIEIISENDLLQSLITRILLFYPFFPIWFQHFQQKFKKKEQTCDMKNNIFNTWRRTRSFSHNRCMTTSSHCLLMRHGDHSVSCDALLLLLPLVQSVLSVKVLAFTTGQQAGGDTFTRTLPPLSASPFSLFSFICFLPFSLNNLFAFSPLCFCFLRTSYFNSVYLFLSLSVSVSKNRLTLGFCQHLFLKRL